MEFLVHIQVDWPVDIDPDEQQRLLAEEAVRARELGTEGRIKRLWRIPGRTANYGLWDAPDATILHGRYGTKGMGALRLDSRFRRNGSFSRISIRHPSRPCARSTRAKVFDRM